MSSILSAERATIATFIKTDSPQIVEVLSLCNLDYVILDAEHAPFDRNSMDRMLLTACSIGLPMLVRIPDHLDSTISSVLDMGAAGIIAPHVDSEEDAANIVAAARFIGGRRGYSGSPRFAGYGTLSMQDAISRGDSSLIVCQIESRAAVAAVERIASVRGVAGLFVGRADLGLSIGAKEPRSPEVMAAVELSIKAANAQSLPVILTVDQDADVKEFSALGARSFVFGSDQSLLRHAAARLPGLLPPRQPI
jgi:2-keto-3-deoxy-L-rhamnonate aldolase RhmA